MDAWIDMRLSQCHPRILEWQGAAQTRVFLESSLRKSIAQLRDQAALTRYATACPVEGAVPSDYGIRVLELNGAGTILAGIHFFGTDVRRPFANITAADFEIDPDSLPLLRELLGREFAVFRPQRFRIEIDTEDACLESSPGAEIDQWILAGRRSEIHERRSPAQSERVSLLADPKLESFDAFDFAYRQFLDLSPGTEEWLSLPGREEVTNCASEGAFFRVCIDGEPGGWIAACRNSVGMLSGWVMQNELLQAAHHGHGLAAAMQRAFIEALPGDENELVWGTIDARNLASLGTARRVGREVVGGFLFLPLV